MSNRGDEPNPDREPDRKPAGNPTGNPEHDFGFHTRAVHAGSRPDPATGARALPIYQTSSYVFEDSESAAAYFNLQEPGQSPQQPRFAPVRASVAVAAGQAAAGDAFTPRLTAVMLLLKPDGICHRNVLSPAPVS